MSKAVDDLIKSLETGEQVKKTAGVVTQVTDPNVAAMIPQEEPVDFLVTGLPNGGRVYRDKNTGRLGYVDQNISGGPEMAQAVLTQLQAGTPKAEITTPYQAEQRDASGRYSASWYASNTWAEVPGRDFWCRQFYR